MAVAQWDIELGKREEDIVLTTSATAITPSAVVILIDQALCPKKSDALQLIDMIQKRIMKANWPEV